MALNGYQKHLWFGLLLILAAMIPVNASAYEAEFLDPEMAFEYELVEQGDGYRLDWHIEPEYYLYRDQFEIRGVDGPIESVEYPDGEMIHDEYFGESQVYYQQAQLHIDPGSATALEVTWQGCAEAGLCYPPQQATLSLDGSDVGAGRAGGAEKPNLAEDQSLAASLAGSSLVWNLALFFGLGLLLVFTPCVLPMVPILSAVIVGSGAGRSRAFALSLAFVLAMALTYAVLGAVAGLLGASLQGALQTPLFVGVLVVIFVALALSMFGLYELQLPQVIRSRLEIVSNRQKGGHLGGAAAMGTLSALLASPCMTAPLAGALLYITDTGNAMLGGMALLALGLGMGAPLVAFGTVGSGLLPRPGNWMNAVKALFGVILLGTAIYFLQRLLPAPLAMGLWGALGILSGVLVLVAIQGQSIARPARGLAMALAAIGTGWGSLLLVGAAGGGTDLWQPLAPYAGTSTAPAQQEPSSGFSEVASLAALESSVEEASERGQWSLLKFNADWCISCDVIDREVFGDAGVQQALSDVHLLEADVTDNSAVDRELMQGLGVVGPPTIILFGPDGQERRGYRVIGEISAGDFLERLDGAQSF